MAQAQRGLPSVGSAPSPGSKPQFEAASGASFIIVILGVEALGTGERASDPLLGGRAVLLSLDITEIHIYVVEDIGILHHRPGCGKGYVYFTIIMDS